MNRHPFRGLWVGLVRWSVVEPVMKYQTRISLHVFLMFFSFLGASRLRAEQPQEILGILGVEFKGFVLSSKSTNKDHIEAYIYEYPNLGVETFSRQNFIGVSIMIDDQGRILLVRPIVAEDKLPDQTEMNKLVDGGILMSKLLADHRFDKMDPFRLYGLLSKWATAVLSADDGLKVNFEISGHQHELLIRLFGDGVQLPGDTSGLSNNDVRGIAKQILRIEKLALLRE